MIPVATAVFILLVIGLVVIAYLVYTMNEASALWAERVMESADEEAAKSRYRASKFQENSERKIEGPGRVNA